MNTPNGLSDERPLFDLLAADIQSFTISPPHLCTPSRIIGELTFSRIAYRLKNATSQPAVLDIGCGYGEYRYLFDNCTYLGVDKSRRRWQAQLPDEANFLLADASCLPVRDQSQDIVLSTYAFEYFQRPDVALCEIRRVLRPNGVAMICLPSSRIAFELYELVPNILSCLGRSVGHVATQDGICYYPLSTISQLATQSGLIIARTTRVYGLSVATLKMLYGWWRVLQHISSRVIGSLMGEDPSAAQPIYQSRRVGPSRNRVEWKSILDGEAARATARERTYVKTVLAAYQIDSWIRQWPGVEYVIELRREI